MAGSDAADRAEVDEHDGSVGFDEDVAGVRVGMEDPVIEDLMEEGLDQPIRDLGRDESSGLDRGHVADVGGGHELLRQHPLGRQ